MSDYLDRLERELLAAGRAHRARSAGSRQPWASPTARRRPHPGTFVAGLAIAVAALVAVLAVALLHHRPASRAGHRPTPNHHRFGIAPGEEIYPLGAVATKAQLLANFGVLRRPQDARDRSWRPDCGCGRASRQLYGLTRYARTLPDGRRVFLDVQQFTLPGQLNLAADSYVLSFDLVGPHGDTNSAAFGPNTSYLVFPEPDGGFHVNPETPRASDWVSLVPDGVATARWTFGCLRGPRLRCAAGTARTYTVPVVQNVAAARISHSGNCPACGAVVRVQWLDGRGAVVASFEFGHGDLAAPPFVAGRVGHGTLDALELDGIGAVRFGEPSATAIAGLRSLLGPAAQSDVATDACGIDHESVWTSPAVALPLTVFERDGRFVGYDYGASALELGLAPAPGASLRATLGIGLGDTIGSLRRRYAGALTTRVTHDAGGWSVRTGGATIGGAVLPIRYPLQTITDRNRIISIAAGDTGC